MLADKWTMLVVEALSSGPMRFGDLRRHIDGVTQKMLTQTLRSLERDGLVLRTVYPTAPPSVEYALTPLGDSITRISRQMCDWAQDNMKPVLLARREYDARIEREAQPVAGKTTVRGGRALRP
jgi:DNA-binding HxlR family transcriptional regulator